MSKLQTGPCLLGWFVSHPSLDVWGELSLQFSTRKLTNRHLVFMIISIYFNSFIWLVICKNFMYFFNSGWNHAESENGDQTPGPEGSRLHGVLDIRQRLDSWVEEERQQEELCGCWKIQQQVLLEWIEDLVPSNSEKDLIRKKQLIHRKKINEISSSWMKWITAQSFLIIFHVFLTNSICTYKSNKVTEIIYITCFEVM